jgi:hypothetical protein
MHFLLQLMFLSLLLKETDTENNSCPNFELNLVTASHFLIDDDPHSYHYIGMLKSVFNHLSCSAKQSLQLSSVVLKQGGACDKDRIRRIGP